MPDTDELRLDAQAFVEAVVVKSFTAEPAQISPFGTSTLTWEIEGVLEHHPPVRLRLSGGGISISIPTSGTRVVAPVRSSSYSLTASLPLAGRLLATRDVVMDTTECISLIVGEAEVASELTPTIEGIVQEHPELSRRRDDLIEVRPDGLHLSLRLIAAIEHAFDPDVNVDAVVSLRAESGRLRYRLDRYSFDVDFPWWQDALIMQFLPAWLAVALAEGSEESQVRSQLIEGVEAFIADKTAEADEAGLVFLSVEAHNDAFEIMLCPVPDESRPARPGGPAVIDEKAPGKITRRHR
jgi:hypothetical protein